MPAQPLLTASAAKPDRNERRKMRTRAAILAAADRVFREKGIDATTVTDVTEEADVAYGSFYNHFGSMTEVVSALAQVSFQRVADRTGETLALIDRIELLPCVGARIILRTLIKDPATRWLIDRPYIFVEEFHRIARPFMEGAEAEAVSDGRLKPAGGHASWLHAYPWLLIAELAELIEDGDLPRHEDRFARIGMRFLGVDDALADDLVGRSLALVGEEGA